MFGLSNFKFDITIRCATTLIQINIEEVQIHYLGIVKANPGVPIWTTANPGLCKYAEMRPGAWEERNTCTPTPWRSRFVYLAFHSIFIRPSSDGTYYGMVMSVRPSVRPGLRPSVRPSVTVFRTFLLHALRYWAEILYNTLLWCT